jgi:hypothetical protein
MTRLLAFIDRLFNKHQFVRRTSFALAWYVVLYVLFTVPLEESVKLSILGIAAGVIGFYHFRKDTT